MCGKPRQVTCVCMSLCKSSLYNPCGKEKVRLLHLFPVHLQHQFPQLKC